MSAVALGVLWLGTVGPVSADPSLAQQERMRRGTDAQRAKEELQRGDAAYQAGNFAEAVEAYGVARDLVFPSHATADIHSAATRRLVQASVERARELAKGGQREEAHRLLDTMLAPDVAPRDPTVLAMKSRIDDPFRTNPALTPGHVADIDKVRRLLYEAEGFSSLGQFERAQMVYEEVLTIDPTNVAARRGMEAASARRSDIYQAGYDEARARMLMQVDAAWETQPRSPDDAAGVQLGLLQETGVGRATAEQKLKTLRVPVVDLEAVDIREAIDFMRQQATALDNAELDPARRGLSFVLDLGTGDSPVARKILEKRFNLLLRSVPLGTILEYITSATGTEARIDEYAIVIRPLGAVSDDIVTRNFRVPPDFLSRGAVNQGDAAADPFADEAPQQGLLGKKLTAEEFLKKQGVPFPDGATATYIASRSILTVRNTSVNLDYVQQVVDSIIEEEPAVVVIEATIISTTQNNLEELGFDWILSDVDVNGNVFLGGGTTGNGQPIQDFGFQGTNAITHGLRSGDRATETSSIDGAIARQQTPSAGGTFELGPGGAAAFTPNQNPGLPSTGDLRAPGAFAVVGAFDPEIVGVLVRGHDRKKDVSLMTQKTVVTRSGQTATIESVREFIYPTEYEPPEIPNQVGSTSLVDLSTGNSITAVPSIATPATPTAFDTTKLGCILEVEPLVDPSRTYVELALKPTIRRFDGFINYGTPIIGGAGGFSFGGVSVSTSFGEITSNEILMPVFSTITSSSNLTIADGSTVVMGGLMTNRRIKVEDKVPIFGDLPLVGRFFQSTADTNIRAALVITVTVRLTDPSGHPFRNR